MLGRQGQLQNTLATHDGTRKPYHSPLPSLAYVRHAAPRWACVRLAVTPMLFVAVDPRTALRGLLLNDGHISRTLWERVSGTRQDRLIYTSAERRAEPGK